MIEDNKKNGGVLSMEALASYEAKTSHIVSGSYRGYDLNALWMPAFGAITIEALQILEQLEGDFRNKFDWAESIYHAIDAAYLDRRVQFTLDDAKRFTSKAWANKRADEIRNKKISSNLKPLPESYTALHGHTTHLTVADSDGMIVSLTQTIGTTMGSKVATPGLGFMYAQTLGGYLGEIKPGVRAPSHISPIIVSREGKPFLALGAAGGSRIPSSIVSVVSRVIDQNLSLYDAMSKPRVHPANGKIEIEVVETDHDKLNKVFDYTVDDTLHFTQKGHSVMLRSGKANFGRVYAIMREGNDWVAVSDPDWQGSSGAVK
jgi:gamma-glutamyltranspeptidase/glutathione hydrolase